MITGEIKNQIDRIWDVFWTSGMTNPMNILEQMTYLFFMKMLDDKQRQEEANAAVWGNRLHVHAKSSRSLCPWRRFAPKTTTSPSISTKR
ncbi:MAG: type I restriction-modification system subunit M N-terminal domain-containing protein [Paludibacteraceae bacterium]|nr:type I restriction-modification system subunit M N-terminal domain-containing protein [Paludibacteraceae bacterium]